MKLENQVCLRKQAEILFNLGVPQESLFKWYHRNKWYWVITDPEDCKSEIRGDSYSAYTVSELGILLGEYTVMKYSSERNWRLYNIDGVLIHWLHTGNEAQARADALIFLIENNKIVASDLKL